MENKAKSFTLIEILVIISIISLLFAAGLAYYNDFNEQEKLKKETEKFVDVLHLARTKAVAGEQNICSNLGAYQIQFSTSSYILQVCCDSNCLSPSNLNTYTLPTTISFLTSSSVIFKRLTGFSNQTTVKIKNSQITKCNQITVEKSGLIKFTTVSCP